MGFRFLKFALIALYITIAASHSLAKEERFSDFQFKLPQIYKVIEEAQIGEISNVDNSNTIRYLQWNGQNDGPPIVIVPGRGEISYQWSEFVLDLKTSGHMGKIYVWDPPGQGLSDRLYEQDPKVGHIDDFSNYEENFLNFLDRITPRESGVKPLVVGHSMGGTIALKAVLQQPDRIEKLILNAPMLDILFHSNPYIDWMVTKLFSLKYLIRIFGSLAVQTKTFPTEFQPNNPYTRDPERWALRFEIQNKYGGFVPGKTIKWVQEALMAIEEVLLRADEIKTKTLLVFGTDDKVTEYKNINSLVCQLEKCRLVEIKDAPHAIHEDFARDILLEETIKHFEISSPQSCETILL